MKENIIVDSAKPLADQVIAILRSPLLAVIGEPGHSDASESSETMKNGLLDCASQQP